MPTFAEIIAAVTDFLVDYQLLIAAGAVTGIAGTLYARFQRGGR